MKRGELWTLAGGGDYAGKPRPVLIIQDDRFELTASVTVCALTTSAVAPSFARIAVSPLAENGLRSPSYLMVDKIITVPRAKLGQRIGRLSADDMSRFERAALVFLGFADTASRGAAALPSAGA